MDSKFCHNCGKEVAGESKFCRFCGAKVVTEKLSSHTSSSDPKIPSSRSALQAFSVIKHTQSTWSFLFLSLITFGLYIPYWGWKYWEIIRLQSGRKLSPGWRGFFITFTCFELFPSILKLAKGVGYKKSYSAGMLAGIFFLLNIFNNLLGRAESIDWILGLFITAVFIAVITLVVSPIINAMNFYLENNQEDSEKLNFGPNYVLIVALVVLIGLVVFGSFYASEAEATDYSEDTRIAFVNGCIEQGASSRNCECLYVEITERYSYSEYVEMDASGHIPDLDEIVSICTSETT